MHTLTFVLAHFPDLLKVLRFVLLGHGTLEYFMDETALVAKYVHLSFSGPLCGSSNQRLNNFCRETDEEFNLVAWKVFEDMVCFSSSRFALVCVLTDLTRSCITAAL